MKLDRVMLGMGIRSNVGLMGAAAVTMIEDDDGSRIIVDAGHFGSRELLLSSLKNRNLTPADFDAVVLTHFHWDHCLNADLFVNAKIVVGKRELERGNLTGIDDVHAKHFKEILSSMSTEAVSEPYKVSKNTSVIDTAGHSPGHISLKVISGEGLIVVAGDAIPNLRAYRRGVPDLIYEGLDESKQSIEKIKALRPKMIIPGHDRPFNDQGYLARDPLKLIFRKESEENLVVGLEDTESDSYQIRY